MYYNDIHRNAISFPRFLGKIVGKKQIYNEKNILDIFNLKSVEITLRIPSKLAYEHSFVAMLMLTEKLLNNKVIFLLDKNTLSKKRTIKIGSIVTLKDEMMYTYLEMCGDLSIPKFYDEGIYFYIPYENNPLAYKLRKILSNTLFSFDKDINSYYDYLGELEYDIDFLFRTHFKSKLLNKLLLSGLGINFINEIDVSYKGVLQEAEERSLIEEFELDAEIIEQEKQLDKELGLEEMDKELDKDQYNDMYFDDNLDNGYIESSSSNSSSDDEGSDDEGFDGEEELNELFDVEMEMLDDELDMLEDELAKGLDEIIEEKN
jgi:hypothetical protein